MPASSPSNASPFGPVIFAYTRANAIEDGVLVAVDEKMAREAGFRFPIAFTAAAWGEAVSVPLSLQGQQDEAGRLWDVLTVARHAARSASHGTDRIPCTVSVLQPDGHHRDIDIELHIGPGDTAAPVLTFMMPGED